eukprot:6417325-Amphidinium_carterae.1
MLGGIPGRSATVMVTALQARIEETVRSSDSSPFSVASLDATKCFDHMLHHVTLQTAQRHGFPVRLIRALGAFYCCQARRYSAGGYLDAESVNPLRGFNQGDALSVWLTNSEVESWQASLPDNAQTSSFLDDRNIVAENPDDLQAALAASDAWEREHGWVLNVAKSKIIGVEIGIKRPDLDVQGSRTATAIRTAGRVE